MSTLPGTYFIVARSQVSALNGTDPKEGYFKLNAKFFAQTALPGESESANPRNCS